LAGEKMDNKLLKAICLTVCVAFLVSGCNSQRDYGKLTVVEPGFGGKFISMGSAAKAVQATGGTGAWLKTKELMFNCVGSFYRSDGSVYLTEFSFGAYPWSNAIRISGEEPKNSFVVQLQDDVFTVLEGCAQQGNAEMMVCQSSFAKSLLDISTAPLLLCDVDAGLTQNNSAIRKHGLWYYRFERGSMPVANEEEQIKPVWSKEIFYQNKATSLVDMLWLADVNGVEFLAVRGYDYVPIEGTGMQAASKIEIFKTDEGGIYQNRLAKIDCYSIVESPPKIKNPPIWQRPFLEVVRVFKKLFKL
jgi:hypothetical protein